MRIRRKIAAICDGGTTHGEPVTVVILGAGLSPITFSQAEIPHLTRASEKWDLILGDCMIFVFGRLELVYIKRKGNNKRGVFSHERI